MNLVFFAHPSFLPSQSMPRFARLLTTGMKNRGHNVALWSPQAFFYRLPGSFSTRKWMGYLDQFLLFPARVQQRLKECPRDTLFVFTDQALGPWVPLVENRFNVVHCHDFLAQRSALGQIPENPVSWTGRQYQLLIRRGYSKGTNFISGSDRTKEDLQMLHLKKPQNSVRIYNGFNQPFAPDDPEKVRARLSKRFGIDFTSGYILHIGGNQWYKNRVGVIEIYNAWCGLNGPVLPLIMMGRVPDPRLLEVYNASPYKENIHLLTGVDDESLRNSYAGASVFVFPSLAEGFGWPVAEAMASGCPVVTTNEAPMSEVAGGAGFLIPRRKADDSLAPEWAAEAAQVVNKVLMLSAEERKKAVEAGLKNARRFDADLALDRIEQIYKSIVPQTT